MAEQHYTAQDYKSALKPIWCPGCGDFGVLTAIQKAFGMLQIPPEEIAVISGIGCSSRLPGYLSTYGFNAIHGRAVPIATAVKVARPEVLVLAVGGDGDGFSIGGGHLAHAARRNVDITYLVMDNQIYGLTKGQLSPTSLFNQVTKTSPYGSVEDPINPVSIMLGNKTSFIARGFGGDSSYLHQLIVKAIQHKGFSFIDILSPCITYRGKSQYDWIRERMVYLKDNPDYDPTRIEHAWRVAHENKNERISLGVIYQEKRPDFQTRIEAMRQKAKARGTSTLEDIMSHFLP